MPIILITTTDPEQHSKYVRWLTMLDASVTVRFLLPEEDIPAVIAAADGLLLPGGGDPHPARYGKPEELHLCNVDDSRDTLEFSAIREAIEHKLPILGICRGLQVMNVALGGSLITDLPSSGCDGHHHIQGKDQSHDIAITPDTFLHDISGVSTAQVNSAHHQGIDILAPRLAVTAFSGDGQAEALEWRKPQGKPFLLLVHWHPERLSAGHSLSDCIGASFLRACTPDVIT